MKFIVPAAAALAFLTPGAFAQTAPAPAPTAAAAKFNLDTPIEALVADPKAKAVLDADLPGVSTHPSYDMFKGMSLRAVQPMSDGKLTDEQLKKVETDLAAIK
jgi:hypothetical protein